MSILHINKRVSDFIIFTILFWVLGSADVFSQDSVVVVKTVTIERVVGQQYNLDIKSQQMPNLILVEPLLVDKVNQSNNGFNKFSLSDRMLCFTPDTTFLSFMPIHMLKLPQKDTYFVSE